MKHENVAVAEKALEEENRKLKESIERLKEENQNLHNEVARLKNGVHGITQKQDFKNALCLLEDVYGELVATTKKEIVHNLQTETDESSRVLFEKHEKIKEEVTAIREQSIALQQRLKAAAAETIDVSTTRQDSLRPTLSELGTTVTKSVPPIDYYIMRGDCHLANSFRDAPETPDFFKSESHRSVFHTRRKLNVTPGGLGSQRVGTRRPSSSIPDGIQGQRKMPTKFRPLTSTQIHREFLLRRINPPVQKTTRKQFVSTGREINRVKTRRPEIGDYLAKI